MTQTEQVINVMREKGGYSTLLELNHSVDVSMANKGCRQIIFLNEL